MSRRGAGGARIRGEIYRRSVYSSGAPAASCSVRGDRRGVNLTKSCSSRRSRRYCHAPTSDFDVFPVKIGFIFLSKQNVIYSVSYLVDFGATTLLIPLPLSFSRVNLANTTSIFFGNSFHPAEGLFRKVFADLLHSYCLGQDRYIQAFAVMGIFYYSAITVAPSFAIYCFRNAFLNAQNEFFETACNYVVNPNFLVFCSSTCDGNLVCVIIHFVVTYLETISSS